MITCLISHTFVYQIACLCMYISVGKKIGTVAYTAA